VGQETRRSVPKSKCKKYVMFYLGILPTSRVRPIIGKGAIGESVQTGRSLIDVNKRVETWRFVSWATLFPESLPDRKDANKHLFMKEECGIT
jgi:hypothetical protein